MDDIIQKLAYIYLEFLCVLFFIITWYFCNCLMTCADKAIGLIEQQFKHNKCISVRCIIYKIYDQFVSLVLCEGVLDINI